MLLAPKNGFVYLAMPKTGSTAIETAFGKYAQIRQQGDVSIKHTRYAQFQRYLEPFLAAKGFPRDSYDVVCAVREPIDWLSSWWRYRTREELANPANPKHGNYTGGLSFEQFARAYMKGGEQFARVGRPAKFIRPCNGKPEIDYIFRYDRLDLLVDFLCGKVDKKVVVGNENASPNRSFSLPEECERELHEYFVREYRVYERAIGG